MSAKPKMTKKTASFHEAKAASIARGRAQKRGAGNDDVTAFMWMNDKLKVADITLLPYTVATLWALQSVSSKVLESETKPAESFALLDLDGDGQISLNDVLGNTRLPKDLVQQWWTTVTNPQSAIRNPQSTISLSDFVAARGLPREVKTPDVLIAALCFAEPRHIWDMAQDPDGMRQIESRAMDLAVLVGATELGQINRFMNRWFALLNAHSEPAAVGKSQPPSPKTGGGASSTKTQEEPAG